MYRSTLTIITLKVNEKLLRKVWQFHSSYSIIKQNT